MTDKVKSPPQESPSLIKKFAGRYSIDPKVLMATLKATCFRVPDGEVSDEQMVALLVVADQYNLNPFTKEIYAFPDKSKGIVPVVSVDGWVRIINEHKDYNGYDVILPEEALEPIPGERPSAWAFVSIRLHRRNVENTPTLTEYLDECYRPPIKKTGSNGAYTINTPWQTHPKRFLRHKALIQAARIVFGFAGIYDEDEALRITGAIEEASVVSTQSRTDNAKDALRKQLTNQAGTGSVQDIIPPAAAAVPAGGKEEPVVRQNTAAHKYDTAGALRALRAAGSLPALKASYAGICDDFEFTNRELPIDVEAVYRDLKEGFDEAVRGAT